MRDSSVVAGIPRRLALVAAHTPTRFFKHREDVCAFDVFQLFGLRLSRTLSGTRVIRRVEPLAELQLAALSHYHRALDEVL